MVFKNPFALAGFLLGTTCFLLALVVLIYRKEKLHRIWAIFNLSVAIWGYSSFAIGNTADPLFALIAWKIAHIGVIFIAVCFFQTTSIFCGVEE